MHLDQFSKSCHFWNIRCLLKPFFERKNSNALLQSFFKRFIELSLLNQFDHFVKAVAPAL